MKLDDLLHASTRPAWTARLLIYIALMVTISVLVQIIGGLIL